MAKSQKNQKSKIKNLNLIKILPGLKKNIPLKNYTTFQIGGKAKYFFVAKKKEDIVKCLKMAKKNNLPFFILGGGSNLLVSDKGFKGLVIKIENKKYKIKKNFLYAEAGVPLKILVKETVKRGLAGLEWAAGIPGTLGGAIRGNAGAFGSQIGERISWVEALDKKGNLKKFSKKNSHFSYRSSIFKKNNLIVLAAFLKLKKGDSKEIKKISKGYLIYRKKRHPFNYPSAGSIFKNFDFKKMPKKWKKFFSQALKKDPFPLIPAAYIISEARLKGLKIGQAQVSEKHPNFIINLGKARAKDVKKLISLIKKKVKNKFGITLEEEIQYLGF